MKSLILTLFICLTSISFSQMSSPDCFNAENVCANNGSTFPLITSTPPGTPIVVNTANNISNPTGGNGGTLPQPGSGNFGCLQAGQLNPNWFVINVGTSGNLEFAIGAAGGSGFFDWELWPYDPLTSCNGIMNNTLAPVACNWNASASGFTGMNNGGPPPGGNAGNFQPSIPVVAGQAFILMFSNYSAQTGNATLSFPANPGSAGITCTLGTPDQTICLGETADVTITPPASAPLATFNWLVTTGVSDPSSGTNVMVTPLVTTDYYVQVIDPTLPGGFMVDTFTIFVIPPPTPYAGPDQTICLGDPIIMAAIISDPVNNTSLWTYDASAVIPVPTVTFAPNFSDPNVTVTVNEAGYYEFYFRETETVCGDRYDTMTVIVDDLQITAFQVSPTCEGYADGEIHIDAPGAVEYSFDGGTTWQPDSFAVVFNQNLYTVCGRTLLGCEKCVDINVIDPAPVTISVSNDTLICQNGTAQLSASALGGVTYIYHWSHTSNLGSAQTGSPSVATTYTVIAESEVGCLSAPGTIDVTIRAPLTGVITPWDTVCPGFDADITAGVIGGIGQPYTFDWSTTETFTGIGSHSINVDPAFTSNYNVTISDGCETTPITLTTNVRVAPLPVPAVNVLDPIQCEPAIFHIENSTDPAMNQFNYWLVNGDQQFLNQNLITTQELWAGDYDVQLVITSFDGCVDSLTFENLLHVVPRPTADFKYSPNPVLMFDPNVHFTNYSILGYTYEWTFDGGFPSTSTETNVDVQFPDGFEGRYDVTLVTTSELGCTDTMIHELIVYPELLIFAPNSFSPNDDEHNQTWNISMEGIDVYDFELLIFNRWGEVIWESHDVNVGWDGTIAGRTVETGTYSWVVHTKDLMNDAKYTFNGHINLLR